MWTVHMLAHTADLASVNTHNDPGVVIKFILQRRKSRLYQLLNKFEGQLLGANGTHVLPFEWERLGL